MGREFLFRPGGLRAPGVFYWPPREYDPYHAVMPLARKHQGRRGILAEGHRLEIERRRRALDLPKVELARLAGVDPAGLRSFRSREKVFGKYWLAVHGCLFGVKFGLLSARRC